MMQPWSDDEHRALFQGFTTLKVFNWPEIASQFVPSRSPDECLLYYNEVKRKYLEQHSHEMSQQWPAAAS